MFGMYIHSCVAMVAYFKYFSHNLKTMDVTELELMSSVRNIRFPIDQYYTAWTIVFVHHVLIVPFID